MKDQKKTRDRFRDELIELRRHLNKCDLSKSSLERALELLREHEAELNDKLSFEHMLSTLSSSFINLAIHNIDSKIEDTLSQFGTLMDADRCFIFRFNEDKSLLHVAHLWEAEGIQRDQQVRGVIIKDNFPWVFNNLMKGNTTTVPDVEELSVMEETRKEYEYCRKIGIQSFIMQPLLVDHLPLCAIGLDSIHAKRTWSTEVEKRLRLMGEVIANAIARKNAEENLHFAYEEIKELKDKLQAERDYLQSEVALTKEHNEIIGTSDVMSAVLEKAEQVATMNSAVLIEGETGSGKELIANAIHSKSTRRGKTMVKVNCAALPTNLIENELFGREKGAYTGALSKQFGRFEIANGSTIFLDEVSELPLELQGKILRVLQDGTFERLGSSKAITVDVRVIAATNKNLFQEVSQGRFREDLYYRINVFPIIVPPLRERQEDILPITWSFIRELEKKMGKRIETISENSCEAMKSYPWPGNVRELRNLIERAMITCRDSKLNIELPKIQGSWMTNGTALEEIEKKHIINALNQTGWRIKGRNGAAEFLSLHPATLHSKMKKLRIQRTTSGDDISSKG